MKRTVKSREELEVLFKTYPQRRPSAGGGWDKEGMVFNEFMFAFCGRTFKFDKQDEDKRLYVKGNSSLYFIEEWLVPKKVKRHVIFVLCLNDFQKI